MSKLEELDISDTDIDGGLKYLPKKKLKEIRCEVEKRKKARCWNIKKKLKEYYSFDEMIYNYRD